MTNTKPWGRIQFWVVKPSTVKHQFKNKPVVTIERQMAIKRKNEKTYRNLAWKDLINHRIICKSQSKKSDQTELIEDRTNLDITTIKIMFSETK